MSEIIEIFEQPSAKEIYMIAGWRQWADAGSISSTLPEYLIQQTKAKKIGTMKPDGFYLFQIPGTHDLVRPIIEFEAGFPKSLETKRNDFFYAGDENLGIIYFIGDEPHLDIDRYVKAFINTAKKLGVKRIIGLGGVYAELPYTKERPISGTYSLPRLKAEMNELAINLSDYKGGASIGSAICRHAYEQDMEYTGFYAFVPTYDFTEFAQIGNSIRIENDFRAWLGIMRRINYMLKTHIDLTKLEEKSQELEETLNEKINDLEKNAPEVNIREYMDNLTEDFEEKVFDPLDDVWTDELRRLLDDDNEQESDTDENAS